MDAKVKILYVEKHALVFLTVKQMLEQEGWEVDFARNWSDAVEKIAQATPYDLIILECKLRGKNGLGLIRQLRSLPHRRQTPVLIFTEEDCLSEALSAGADAYLPKPEGIRSIVATARRLLRTRKVIHDQNVH